MIINVNLTKEQEAALDAEVATGRFSSREEVIYWIIDERKRADELEQAQKNAATFP